MNKTLTYLIITTLISIYSCKNNSVDTNHIIVSILPQKNIVSKLLPEDYKVSSMVTKGNSPATYSPTPSQIKDINEASIYIQIGNIGFENAWIHRFKDLNPNLKVENSSTGINFIHGEDFEHGDHVHEGGIEPHIWTSPKTMLKVVYNSIDILKKNYPNIKDQIEKNSKPLIDSLLKIDTLYKNTLDNYKGKSFLIFHPAYTYLARDYGINQISIEHNGKEPSVKWLQSIIKEAKEKNIKAIFVQQEFDKRNAEILSKELGINIIEVSPLKEDYEKEMKDLLEKLKNTL